MPRNVTVTACGLCGDPLTKYDSDASPRSTPLKRKDGLLIEAGYSRGGWGFRDLGQGVRINFSDEVCCDCFDHAQALLRPVQEFLRGGARRQEHHVHPVRDNVMEPERRGASILRALPFFHRKADA